MDSLSVPTRDLAARYRKIGNRRFLVVGPNVFELDEVGYIIWEQCSGGHNVGQIASSVCRAFPEADAAEVEADTWEFLNNLKDVGALATV